MRETPLQYRKRILGYVEGQHPLKVLRSTGKRLGRLLKGVPRKRLRRRPAPKKWSIGEIVAHLADVELVIGYRLRMMLSANGTSIQAMDQEKWAVSGGYARRDARRSLEQFRAMRKANLVLLGSIPKKKWNNYGLHEERGRETIARTVEIYAGHDINHLKQIERILNSARSA